MTVSKLKNLIFVGLGLMRPCKLMRERDQLYDYVTSPKKN